MSIGTTSVLPNTTDVSSQYSVTSTTMASAVASSDSDWLVVRLVESFYGAILTQYNETTEIANNENNTKMINSNSFLSYWISPFALMCMITAVILNRVIIFSSTRKNEKLPIITNLFLRLLSIFVLIQGSYPLLLSMKNYYFQSSKLLDLFIDFEYDLIGLFSRIDINHYKILFFNFDIDQMPNNGGLTTSIFKPFHLSLCISQILDTFISVSNGYKPSIETGITLFEYSLAFQEAQIVEQPSLELLVMASIAFLNQFNVHLLTLLKLKQFKLVVASAIGLFTLFYYLYNMFNKTLYKLPVIIIIGYFPYVCVLVIILISLLIFVTAGVLNRSFDKLIVMNLLNFKNLSTVLGLSRNDDFFNLLLKVGEFLINISINKSYIIERLSLNLPKNNYIELLKNGYNNDINDKGRINRYLAGDDDEYENEDDDGQSTGMNYKKTWNILNRLKGMNMMIWKFLRLLRIKISRSDINGEQSRKKVYKIVSGADGMSYISSSWAKKQVDIDAIKEEEIVDHYSDILLNMDLMENDGSADYVDMDENDLTDEDWEYEKENDTDEEGIQESDLMDIGTLIIPKQNGIMDNISQQILNFHLQYRNEKPLTRSNFTEYYIDDLKLLDLLKDTRINKILQNNKHQRHENDESHQINNDELGLCVICHENSRQIILWPCRCLSICESCRTALYAREFGTCVCCRSPVEGYSRVYIP